MASNPADASYRRKIGAINPREVRYLHSDTNEVEGRGRFGGTGQLMWWQQTSNAPLLSRRVREDFATPGFQLRLDPETCGERDGDRDVRRRREANQQRSAGRGVGLFHGANAGWEAREYFRVLEAIVGSSESYIFQAR